MCAKAKTRPKKTSSDENFFVLHGEKIAIVVVLLLVVWLIKDGSGLEKFTLTPEAINQSATKAEDNIKNSKVKPVEVDSAVVVYDYGNYSRLIKNSLKVNAYETPVRWDQSLFPDKIKRPNIVPLAVENLQAIACIGAIEYSNKTPGSSGGAMGTSPMGGSPMGGAPMGGSAGGMGGMGAGGKVEGKQWITVTGSIPVRKQLADYMSKFTNAQYTDMMRDYPKYILYELERGTPDANGDVTWEKVDIFKAFSKENNQWSRVGMEPVDMSYFAQMDPSYPPMAMSCPPMTNRPFGEEVANFPLIPVRSDEMMELATTEMEQRNKMMEEMQNVKFEDVLKRSPFSENASRGGSMGGMGGGSMPGMGGGSMPGMGGAMGSSSMGGSPGGSMTGGMGGAGRSSNQSWMVNTAAGNMNMTGNAAAMTPVDYYLFRFFDFDIKDGVTYVYRVRLILANPNYNIDPNFVDDPKTVAETFVMSGFSEVSNPVSVGRVSRIYAEQVELPKQPGEEPKVTLASIYFDKDSSTESVVKGQKVIRGQVANFPKQTHKPVETQSMPGMMGMMGSSMGAMGPGGMPAAGTTGRGKGASKGGGSGIKQVDHTSDVCIVDIYAGDLPTGERSSGKVIILEPSGIVQVRDIRQDLRDLKIYEDGSSRSGTTGTMGPMGAMGSMM